MIRKARLALVICNPLLLLAALLFSLSRVSSQDEPEAQLASSPSKLSAAIKNTTPITAYLPFVTNDYHKRVSWTFKGVALDGYWVDAFSTQRVRDQIDYAQSLGANSISPVVTWYQENLTTSGPISPTERTIADKDLEAVIDYIHDRGMSVMLKPHVDPEKGWRGQLKPGDPDAWFESYTNFLLHYVDIAKRHDVEVFCIGAEYVTLTDPVKGYPDHWSAVIDAVRATGYKGKLTYAAHMVTEYRDFPTEIWKKLDLAGVNFYHTLSFERTPSTEDLVSAWSYYEDFLDPLDECKPVKDPKTYLADLAEWQLEHGKPVIFPEIGYRSIDYAATWPWVIEGPSHPCLPASEALNEQGQANAYDAVLRTLDELDWMAGAYWWRLEAEASGGALGGCHLPEFDFTCKQAARILRLWYGGREESLSCERVPTPGLPTLDAFEYTSNGPPNHYWQVRGSPQASARLSMDASVHAPWGGSTRSLHLETHVPSEENRSAEIIYHFCDPQDWSAYTALDVWVRAAPNQGPDGGEFSILLIDAAKKNDSDPKVETWVSTRWLDTDGEWARVRILLEGDMNQSDVITSPWAHSRDFVIPWGPEDNKVLDLTQIHGVGIRAFTGQDDSEEYPDFEVWVDDLRLSKMPKGLLDDFEGEGKNVWSGSWYTYTDVADEGTSTIHLERIEPGAGRSAHALHMDGQVTKVYRYGYVGFGTLLQSSGEPITISDYSRVSFKARGDGKDYRVRLETKTVSDTGQFNYYGHQFNTGPAWQRVSVLFDNLSQEKYWGIKVPWTVTDVMNLSFQTVGQPHPER